MRNKFKLGIVLIVSLISGISCNKTTKKIEEEIKFSSSANVPKFNSDSAYSYVQDQVDFGPRVPNSKAHEACADYLVNKLKTFNADVKTQEFTSEAFDGKQLKLKNIIGSFNPEIPKRILLAAHWDTRPFAEEDATNPKAPSLGANDGGSGVGVLLEIGRLLSQNPDSKVGIDIIFFDGEDYGDTAANNKETWCLGSQYWARNKHVPNYSAYYGILLDMVGAKNAKFSKEGFSVRYAGQILNDVWETGNQLGFGEYFINNEYGTITDDHKYINEIAKFPMIDIIELHPERGFGDYWHTHKDNMEIIDKNTLNAVGRTVLHVIYNEPGPGDS